MGMDQKTYFHGNTSFMFPMDKQMPTYFGRALSILGMIVKGAFGSA